MFTTRKCRSESIDAGDRGGILRNLEASRTERVLDPVRVKHLRQKAEAGQLVTFHWSKAKLGSHLLRMNGQHSSNMLAGLNGQFPHSLKVHIDTYEVDTESDLSTALSAI